jgi:arsenate reductase
MKNILVLCTGNSCRSQMAEAWLKYFLDTNHYSVISAGVEAHGINPYMKKVVEDSGLNIDSHTSNLMSEYDGILFDIVITVCDNAKDNCPYFKDAVERLHHTFLDPANAKGSDEEKLKVYQSVNQEIKEFCQRFSKKLTVK